MKKIILIALAVITISAQAQPVYRDRIGFDLESIADIDIGWMEIRKHTTAPKGKQLGDRIYSAKQIDNCQKFVEWMQQSYLPRGCLGNTIYYQNYIPKFSGTNSQLGNAIDMHRQALPHMYGAVSRMYMFLKKDEKDKFVPQNTFAEYWNVEVNQLERISKPVSFISSDDEYYFVLPDFNNNAKSYDSDDKAASNFKDFNNHKNIQAYQHFYIPPKVIDDFNYYVVVLTKDNKKLPFEKITIGDFFTQVEEQLPVWQKVDPVSPENFALAQKNLARLKEKYKTKWNDFAELQLSQTEITLTRLVNATEGYTDMFDNKDIYGEKGEYTTFPILKVSKSAKELCKTNEPQWLVVRWTVGMSRRAFNIHLHESILNNFNFEYLYNYFYNPEKVKGQTYKPLCSPSFKEAVVVREPSEATKKNYADKNIYFFEDISKTVVGKTPIGWKSEIGSGGSSSVVTNLPGLEGNWAVVADYTITPTQIKIPLPQNLP
jgi:hypothetical protein